MLKLRQGAQRIAKVSQKPSDPQSHLNGVAETQGEGPDTGSFPSIVCGSDCWVRRADLEALDPTPKNLSRLDNCDQQYVAKSNAGFYKGLRPWQSRLVVLQPGELGSKIQIKLVVVDVIDRPGLGISETTEIVAYEALSYSWGSRELLYPVYCDDEPFGVTEALASALNFLRLRDVERHIWCDAICINQQDLVEKAYQVKNMLRIYEKADRVIAWLGWPRSTSAKLFKAIELICTLSADNSEQKHQDMCASGLQNIATAVTEHLQSAWFRRAWIRQEVYAAKKLLVQTGKLQSDFLDFSSSLVRIQTTIASYTKTQNKFQIPPTLMTYQNEYQHFGSDGSSFKLEGARPTYVQYWMESVDTGLKFDVEDERDRIYGALGLLTSSIVKFFAEVPADLEKKAESFPVDYSKSLSQVHEDVTKFLINATGSLEVLDVFQESWHATYVERPSWNLDFSRKQKRHFLAQMPSSKEQDVVRVPVQDHLDIGRLKLAGFRVAKFIQRLDREKEISHRQDRFIPKFKRSITLRQIMHGTQRRSSGGLSSGIDNPPFAFIFSHVNENAHSHAISITHHLAKSDDLGTPFAEHLSSSEYAFAYVDDLESAKSFDLASLHILVPRTASLNDAIVSFHGSKCLHLIQPLYTGSKEWKYAGPVAAVAIGQKSIAKYGGFLGGMPRTGQKDVQISDGQQVEEFTLR